jgi:hypothetical protein
MADDKVWLDELSVKELLELQARIHAQVRTLIRKQNEAKAAPAPAPPTAPLDLERERDAWLAARRGKASGSR